MASRFMAKPKKQQTRLPAIAATDFHARLAPVTFIDMLREGYKEYCGIVIVSPSFMADRCA